MLCCGVPLRALWRAAHCGTPYVHGQLWGKNDWQFSNPRIDTARTPPSIVYLSDIVFKNYINMQHFPIVKSVSQTNNTKTSIVVFRG